MMRRQHGEMTMAATAAPQPADLVERGPAYDEDFALWTQHRAALIRAGRFDLTGQVHLAEEIESLASAIAGSCVVDWRSRSCIC